MKVYHGSYTEIETIDLSLCEIGKDFGQGFYVTNIRSQAEYWAIRKGKRYHNSGFVTEFEYDENISRMMKLKMLRFEDYTDEWLDFVVLNRINNTEQQAHDYDIVEGPVANDKITTQIYDYIKGSVSRKKFLNDLIYLPSHQICFCTVQSLQTLELLKGKIYSLIYHIDDNILQSLMIDCGLNEIEAIDIYYSSNTATQLADHTTELYQKQWQEIYEMLNNELNKKK